MSNARGLPGGGMLKLRFDRCITYEFDSLLQADAILVVAFRSLACRSPVNRALFSLVKVTHAVTIK